MSKYKKITPLFLFIKGQTHQNQFVYFNFYVTVETRFKMKLNTHVIKYTDTLTLNFAHTINHIWSIMPL